MTKKSLCKNILAFFFCVMVLSLMRAASAKENARFVMDMYRSNQVTQKELYSRLKNDFQSAAEISSSSEGISSKKNKEKFLKLMEKVYLKIEKMGDFAYYGVTPIFYEKDPTVYFSVDLVDKKDEKRLSGFLKKPTKKIADPYRLIQSWKEYEKIGSTHFLKERINIQFKTCPAFHCLFGFDHPLFKKYQQTFTTMVPKAKLQLIQVLKYDQDEQKRASAAYLLAHIRDGKELVKILIPSMRDPSGSVRNNVLRVLGETLSKVKDVDFPMQDAIDALDFPLTIDRNKALYVVSSLSLQPRYAKYIAKHAGDQLISELKLSQKNVHDISYTILKQISGKNFADRDYHSWELWLKENK